MARKTKEDAQETRRKILEAALELFSEKGYSQTTSVDIAQRIDMTKGAVYWHFRSKPELVAALIDEMQTREEKLTAQVVPQLLTLDDLLNYLVVRTRVITSDEPCRKFFRFVSLQMEWSVELVATIHAEMGKVRQVPFLEIIPLLERAREGGHLREDVDLTAVKDILLGLWVGLLTTHFQGLSSTDPVKAAEIAIGTLIESIKA